MKNDGQPIRDFVPWNSQSTKDPHWLENVFLFSTEIWAEQLKKTPYIGTIGNISILQPPSSHNTSQSNNDWILYRWMVAMEQWVQRDMERAADHGPGATNRGEWFVSMKTLHRWKIGKTFIPRLSAYIKSGLQEFKIIHKNLGLF